MARTGFHISDNDAEVLGRRIEKLRGGRLVLEAEELLTDAEDKQSPIHKYFDWDDKSAAVKHRLDQARYYIRAIEVEIHGGQQNMKVYECVTLATGATGYARAEQVLQRNPLRQQIAARAKQMLTSWLVEYKNYSPFSKAAEHVQAAIDALKDEQP